MSEPTYEEDLERVMALGYGRRVLARMIRDGAVKSPFHPDAANTAYNLGLTQHSRDLDDLLRSINGEYWLIMKREELKMEEDSSLESRT